MLINVEPLQNIFWPVSKDLRQSQNLIVQNLITLRINILWPSEQKCSVTKF